MVATDFGLPDHYEFNATLSVPFQVQAGGFPIRIDFDYPGAGDITRAAWLVEVLSPTGAVIGSDSGIATLAHGRGVRSGRWNGFASGGRRLPAGYYTVRLRAVPMVEVPADARLSTEQRVRKALAVFADEVVEQRYDVMLGQVPKARLRAMVPLPTGPTSARATGAPLRAQSLVAPAVACPTPSTTATCTARPTTVTAAPRWPPAAGQKRRRPAPTGRPTPTR
ncbi:hypothetical protein LJB71_02190 [Thermomonas sp. S9]|uniref:hypothetical protein n=1 Tax=Thermomonas sp. S9 TaxID=2885203 RepID=UPI00216B27E2|nr:hypothetical protein [Thermomonas sp. S9]MCR6495171.1 hypothetical protein [Thermomonas sp. S9]